MKWTCRAEGKVVTFDTRAEYDAYIEKLRRQGKIVTPARRERSRRTRPSIERVIAGRTVSERHLKKVRRFTRPNIHPPEVQGWTFSLVHPTRDRPIAALECLYRWFDLCSPFNRLDYILSLDTGDATKYADMVKIVQGNLPLQVLVRPNATMVEALNKGAELARGDVLVYVSDDFECPPNWDVCIANEVIKAGRTEKDPWVLFVFDGNQRIIQTICIMSRAYYKRFGYIYHPAYKSMFVDNEYTDVALKSKQVIHAEHLLFRHHHVSRAGGMPWDATYARQNSRESWAHGERVYHERKAKGFP